MLGSYGEVIRNFLLPSCQGQEMSIPELVVQEAAAQKANAFLQACSRRLLGL